MRTILDTINRLDRKVKTVAIGGINLSNVQRVLYQSASAGQDQKLDGVAVVSAIMAAKDPKSVAEQFKQAIATPPAFVTRELDTSSSSTEVNELAAAVPEVIRKVVETHPIVHSMINFVVANFVANVAISA